MSGAPARQQATSALAKRLPEGMVGSYTTANAINARLADAAEQAHLVSPMTSVGALPPGWAVAITSVLIDTENETYPTGGGKRGLAKVALDRISSAAGISWVHSQRVDDGSHPHFCAWRVVGSVRNFDGTSREIVGSKTMDLRDGSETAAQLGTKELAQMRRFICEHAESKARLRAVRAIGVATGYTQKDLQKPFVIAQLMFTGRVQGDPELERALALRLADAALGGRQSLYGSASTPAPRALEAPPPAPRLAPPPPVGSVPADEDDDLPESWGGAPARAQRQPERTQEPARQREPGDDDEHVEPPQRQRASGLTIPGGREKGTPIEEASESTLQWWATKIAENLDAGDSRYPDRDQRLLDAMRTELEARR